MLGEAFGIVFDISPQSTFCGRYLVCDVVCSCQKLNREEVLLVYLTK